MWKEKASDPKDGETLQPWREIVHGRVVHNHNSGGMGYSSRWVVAVVQARLIKGGARQGGAGKGNTLYYEIHYNIYIYIYICVLYDCMFLYFAKIHYK